MFDLLKYSYFVGFVAIVFVISMIFVISYFAHHQELADIRYSELQQQAFQNRYELKRLESQKYLDMEKMRLEAEMNANVQGDPMESLAMLLMSQKKDKSQPEHVNAELVKDDELQGLNSEIQDLYKRYPIIYEKMMSGELFELLGKMR